MSLSAQRRGNMLQRGLLPIILILCAVDALVAQPAQQLKTKDPADELRDKYTLQQLLDKDPGAVKNAEKFFALTTDINKKQKVASILLSIGVPAAVYFNYLSAQAKKSLNVGIPWPTLYDEDGNVVKGKLNPAFLEWCAQRELEPLSVFESTYYEIPGPWRHLAAASDPRAYQLLIEGLHSTNFVIASYSALGLAKLQDSRAIPEIIAALRRAPLETRFDIAEALLYFPDPRAQAVAEEFIPDKNKLAIYRSKVKRDGVRGILSF